MGVSARGVEKVVENMLSIGYTTSTTFPKKRLKILPQKRGGRDGKHMTVQERPSYSIAANFRYKYQAAKAFRTVSELLKDDMKLMVFFIHDPTHGWYQLSNWFVAVFGLIPAFDMDTKLKDALRAAKGELVQFDDAQLHDMLKAYKKERPE
jgi:adenine-specific DNA methylase